jgi:hypothetical protein
MKQYTRDPHEEIARYRQDDPGDGMGMMLLLHLLCCGVPLLVLGLVSLGLSTAILWSIAPYLAAVGGAVFSLVLVHIWRRRRCMSDESCRLPVAVEHQRRLEDTDQARLPRFHRLHMRHREEL